MLVVSSPGVSFFLDSTENKGFKLIPVVKCQRGRSLLFLVMKFLVEFTNRATQDEQLVFVVEFTYTAKKDEQLVFLVEFTYRATEDEQLVFLVMEFMVEFTQTSTAGAHGKILKINSRLEFGRYLSLFGRPVKLHAFITKKIKANSDNI